MPFAAAPLAVWQQELLELAFASASKFPLDPHIKNRARAQERVVRACLELGQPSRALRYLQEIPNWRRGLMYAELAFWASQHGRMELSAPARERLHAWLDTALDIAHQSEALPTGQQWRVDRVRSRVAATWIVLGELERAAALTRDLTPSELRPVDEAMAGALEKDQVRAQIDKLREALATESFERAQSTLWACLELYTRFFDEAESRDALEGLLRKGFAQLPGPVRIDLLLAASRVALEHEDVERARSLFATARGLRDTGRWLAENEIPLRARFAQLHHRLGETRRAEEELASALARYRNTKETGHFVDMFRAEALRPVAETYAAIGATEKAIEVYRLLTEEGVANPNSRPRAFDLVGTCLSLALHGIEPPQELRARLHAIGAGLSSPW